MTPRRAATPKDELAETLARESDTPPISLALIDVDDFAGVNTDHGRQAGDRVLAHVEQGLSQALPDGTGVVRLGGDEFACALPQTTPEQALLVMERARSEIASRRIAAGKKRIDVNISIGIASFPQHVESPEQLLQAADEALHRAKAEGRARAAIYVEDKMVLKSNYYSRAQLGRLSSMAEKMGVTEAALLREALSDLLDKHRNLI